MATIKRSVIRNYVRMLDGIKAEARNQLERGLMLIDFGAPDAYDAVLALLRSVGIGSSALASQAGAEFYDALRAAQTGEVYGAVGFSAFDENKAAAAAGAAVAAGKKGGAASALSVAFSRVAYDVAKSAGDTQKRNGENDRRKPRFARVPSGVETCDFCLMLASRGFVYWSRESAGDNDHYHANCTCSIVPDFGGAKVEGYDPDALYRQWSEAAQRQTDV